MIPFLNERDCRHLCREPSPNPAGARLAGKRRHGRGGADRRGKPRLGQRTRAKDSQGERGCLWVASAHLVSTGCRYCRACAGNTRARHTQPTWDRGHCRPRYTPSEGRGRTEPLPRCRSHTWISTRRRRRNRGATSGKVAIRCHRQRSPGSRAADRRVRGRAGGSESYRLAGRAGARHGGRERQWRQPASPDRLTHAVARRTCWQRSRARLCSRTRRHGTRYVGYCTRRGRTDD